jgi:arsenate reductase (glutaredoxin)
MTALKIERMYWLPYCSTCIKAEQFWLDKRVTIEKYINVKETSVSKEELLELSAALGSVEALFSKRAMKYRSMGLNEKTLSDEDMLGYMIDEYTFIKRPVIVTNTGKVLAGFSAKQAQALL